jgi:hypothetical protein
MVLFEMVEDYLFLKGIEGDFLIIFFALVKLSSLASLLLSNIIFNLGLYEFSKLPKVSIES